MSKLEDYANRYKHVRMDRQDGILLLTLHTEGKELRWGPGPHAELADAFHDVAQDRENRIVILTGTGSEFSGPRPDPTARRNAAHSDSLKWDHTYSMGKHLLMNLLSIEVPMIAAVNGPAMRHSELPLLCDIVLAAENASFQDSGHFVGGLMPGDGVQIVYPLLLGLNRARYFLLTGQTIAAAEAKTLGLVNEVLPGDKLLDRAWELARQLNKQNTLMLRYTRVVMTEHLKRQLQEQLGYGLALEGLALLEPPPTS